MVNIRNCAIAAVIGFVLSLLVGLVSGAALFVVLFRALIFAVVFFVLGAAIQFLVGNYVPEILEGDDFDTDEPVGDNQAMGSRVNMTVGDDEEAAVPKMYRDRGEGDEVGDIGDLVRGVDQKAKADYTIKEAVFHEAEAPEPRVTARRQESPISPPDADFVPVVETVDVLPDLDSMAGSFLSSDGKEMAEGAVDSAPASVLTPKRSSGGKSVNPGGDFNPKELAQAIRTKLNKD
ncbi:MAG: hypothetical protein LBC57_02065 [Treponema sp.]|jgi:hypothetical protein|nr:hypothetical protein [Treponema sp.]